MEELTTTKSVSNTNRFTAQEVRDLEFVYNIFDVNGCGVIEGEEVRKALRLLAFKVNRKTVHQMLQGLAVSTRIKAPSRNAVDFEGFLEIVAKLQGSSFDQHEEIMDAFGLIDVDGDGYITVSDLRKYAPRIGLTLGDVHEMLAEADKDGDGKINKQEFLYVMKHTNLFISRP